MVLVHHLDWYLEWWEGGYYIRQSEKLSSSCGNERTGCCHMSQSCTAEIAATTAYSNPRTLNPMTTD